MNDLTIKNKIYALRKHIRRHDYLYYIENQPEISDVEYDKLIQELVSLEKLYPQYVTPDSPTQRVAGHPTTSFSPVKHAVPMLSLANTYNENELLEWFERVEKTIKNDTYTIVVEPKIDGVGLAITYENGKLTKGATRGDGETGDDVTANTKTIKSISLQLFSDSIPAYIEVRGEVYIDKSDFLKLNEKASKNGEELFANPRNAAAGSLRQKNPKTTSMRPLKFFAHSFGKIEHTKKMESHWDFLNLCKKIGIRPVEHARLCSKPREAIDYCKKMEDTRDTLPYEIDGMVLKINSFKHQKLLGFTMKNPRWAIAFKFSARQATTKVIAIKMQVGRTGAITPVANLEPVELSGVTITNATLHNFDEIERLDIRIGDTVLIERAGDVIPKVVKVITTKRNGHEEKLDIPKRCPACKGPVTKEKEDDVIYRCLNPACPEQIEQGLIHFAKRDAMDIEGFGEMVVKQLLEKKLVSTVPDIYKLTKEQLLTLDLFKQKKAENLLRAIENSKKQPLSRLLFALGIRNVGEKAAQTLAERFLTLDNLMKATIDDLTNVLEVGPVIANSVVVYFSQDTVKKMVQELKTLGMTMDQPLRKSEYQPLYGKTFVLTGELDAFSRFEAEKLIKELGGNPTSSVSKKTDYIIVGKNPGSKLRKAKKLGIPIIDEEGFAAMITQSPLQKHPTSIDN